MKLAILLTLSVTATAVAGLGVSVSRSAASEPVRLEDLGEALFFDVNLSKNRTQSCASCHDPDHGFADPRGAAHRAP